MASPQCEDGYTRIANEIMDALAKIRIPGEERQVLDSIMRKTYGWNKCEDLIALSQFVEMTGLNKPHIIRAIQGLLSKKVIIVTEKGNDPAKVYKFNKNHDEWIPLPKKVTLPKKVISVAEKDNPSLPKKGTTKYNNTKDTSKDKKILSGIPSNGIPYQDIIDYLNQQTGKTFSYKSDHTKILIHCRWNEGHRFEQFQAVIDIKCSKWLTDAKMIDYLRPETLFGTRFESYLNEITHPLSGQVSDTTKRNLQVLDNWKPPA